MTLAPGLAPLPATPPSPRLARAEAGLAGEASAADVGAQRDVLRLLQRAAAGLQPEAQALASQRAELRERARAEESCAEQGAEHRGGDGDARALRELQARLAHLRGVFLSMRRRCEDRDSGVDGPQPRADPRSTPQMDTTSRPGVDPSNRSLTDPQADPRATADQPIDHGHEGCGDLAGLSLGDGPGRQRSGAGKRGRILIPDGVCVPGPRVIF